MNDCPIRWTEPASIAGRWAWLRPSWERLGYVAFVGQLLILAPLALRRMLTNGGTDFPEFYAAGRYVLVWGERQPGTILAYYWPSLDVAWAFLAWMPVPLAAVTWFVAVSLAYVGLLAASAKYLLADWEPRLRRQAALAAGLLVMPLALDHLCLGAFHIVMLWWMVLGLGRAVRGKWFTGGLFLGMAVWIKLLPAIGVGYLVLKRQWRAAGTALVAAVAIDVGLSLIAFSPSDAWQYHVRWWQRDGFGTTDRIISNPTQVPEHRCKNQALPAVLRRVLTPLPVYEPSEGLYLFNVALLEPAHVKRIYQAILACLTLAIAWGFRRPSAVLPERRRGMEIAIMTMATLWYSPVAWSYHPTAIAPLLSLIIVRFHQRRAATTTLMIVWLIAMALLGYIPARGWGEMLWASAILSAGLIYLTKTDTRQVAGNPFQSATFVERRAA